MRRRTLVLMMAIAGMAVSADAATITGVAIGAQAETETVGGYT